MANPTCVVDAKATGELSAEAICALFQPLLEKSPGARLAIAMPSDHQATVQLLGADGALLAEAGGSVSDRQFYRGAWENIAAALAAQLR